MPHDCPSCEYESDSERGVAIHHNHAHGESIAKSSYECDNCGEQFERYDCDIKDTAKYVYCGDECRDSHQATLPPEQQPNYQGGKETVECAACDSKKQVKSYRLNRSERFFCGHDCYADWKAENIAGADNPNFDSIEVECDWCGELTYKIESRIERSKRDFCSHDCHNKWMAENLVGENSPHWDGGRRDYGPGWHSQKREAVRERDNRECHDCGMSEEQSIAEFGRKLDVHHLVVPDSDTNPAVHNAKRNLVTLCIPCHREWEKNQTPTNTVAASMEVTKA